MNDNVKILATHLAFPEGPIAMPDGSVVFVEIGAGQLSRWRPNGQVEAVAQPGGGPNGATSDQRDRIYIAQNGGNWMRNPDPTRVEPGMSGGVQCVIDGEAVWVSRNPLAPNDLCFGPDGLLYVT
ncbi:MAG TPA: SMP-30/gluconolactonase/LRE family protein, partial [Burkholderiaceae bacterium]